MKKNVEVAPIDAIECKIPREGETMGQLQPQVLERISGSAWNQIRDAFLTVSDALLSVNQEAYGQLTTIYVKFTTSSGNPEPYAVVWIKTSKELVVGLALSESVVAPFLGDPPAGTKYKGLTKYFSLHPGDTVPFQLNEWAIAAYENIVSKHSSGSSDN